MSPTLPGRRPMKHDRIDLREHLRFFWCSPSLKEIYTRLLDELNWFDGEALNQLDVFVLKGSWMEKTQEHTTGSFLSISYITTVIVVGMTAVTPRRADLQYHQRRRHRCPCRCHSRRLATKRSAPVPAIGVEIFLESTRHRLCLRLFLLKYAPR